MAAERWVAPPPSRSRHEESGEEPGPVLEHGPAERICPGCGARNKAWRRYCADCEADLEPLSAGAEEVSGGSRLESAIRRSRDAAALRPARLPSPRAAGSAGPTAAERPATAKPLPAGLGRLAEAVACASPVNRVIALICCGMVAFALAYYGFSAHRHAPPPPSFEVRAAAPTIPPPTSPTAPVTPALVSAPEAPPPLSPAASDGPSQAALAPTAAAPARPALRRRRHAPARYCTHHGRVCVRRVPTWGLY